MLNASPGFWQKQRNVFTFCPPLHFFYLNTDSYNLRRIQSPSLDFSSSSNFIFYYYPMFYLNTSGFKEVLIIYYTFNHSHFKSPKNLISKVFLHVLNVNESRSNDVLIVFQLTNWLLASP